LLGLPPHYHALAGVDAMVGMLLRYGAPDFIQWAEGIAIEAPHYCQYLAHSRERRKKFGAPRGSKCVVAASMGATAFKRLAPCIPLHQLGALIQ